MKNQKCPWCGEYFETLDSLTQHKNEKFYSNDGCHKPVRHYNHEELEEEHIFPESPVACPRQIIDEMPPEITRRDRPAIPIRSSFKSSFADSYSSSVPKVSFLSSYGQRSSPISAFAPQKRNHFGLASPTSYNTAHSSLASYATAHSVSQPTWIATSSSAADQPESIGDMLSKIDATLDGQGCEVEELDDARYDFEPFVDHMTSYILDRFKTSPHIRKMGIAARKDFRKRVKDCLAGCATLRAPADDTDDDESGESRHASDPADGTNLKLPTSRAHKIAALDENLDASTSPDMIDFTKSLMIMLHAYTMESSNTKPFKLDSFEEWRKLFDALDGQIGTYLRGKFTVSASIISPVFSSWWLKHLHERGILVDPKDELDWSGRGQHIEYDADEESIIPLQMKRVLGYSPTAIVESVQCRRILLARKTVKCTRRLTKENVVTEVEHLQRVQHSHIVRVVGTYTIRKTLAILIYPVADQNLEELMDDVVDLERDNPRHAKAIMPTFFGCLSRAIAFIHGKNVKHMDIKPKNILVRQSEGHYKVYVADFGIARSYKSAAESFTDNPTSYTRTYAAPEVVMQDVRGYPADIFSLRCVFMEMLAAMVSSPKSDQRDNLATIRGVDYQSNTEAVLGWYHDFVERRWSDESYLPLNRHADDPFFQALQRTLSRLPEVRPLAIDLQRFTSELCCSTCGDGPEPFEANTDGSQNASN